MSETQHSPAELVREGGAALRGGDRERARRLLAQAVRAEPRNEQAWLLLAGAVSDPEQRRTCLERVLRLNPEHQIARRALAAEGAKGDGETGRQGEQGRSDAGERPATQAQPVGEPAAGSLLDRLRAPGPVAQPPAEQRSVLDILREQPQPEPAVSAAAPAEQRSVLDMLRTPAADSSPPTPDIYVNQHTALELPRPTPVVKPKGGTIELSDAAVQRRKQERQQWMAVLALGLVMMLAGLSLAGIVLLAG